MTFFKRFLVFILASHTLISSFFMINVYAIFDDSNTDEKKCIAYLQKHPKQFCYDFVINGLNYCPIDRG